MVNTKRFVSAAIAGTLISLSAASPALAWTWGRNYVRPDIPYTNVHATAPNGDPAGPYIGALKYPQTFEVKDTRAARNGTPHWWCWGFAYGNVNSHGWVQCDALKAM